MARLHVAGGRLSHEIVELQIEVGTRYHCGMASRHQSGEPVTVLETSDPGLLAVAKSLLDDAGIPYFAKGEWIQDLFGLGRFGTGFSPIVGPVELQVSEHDAAEAHARLIELTRRTDEG